MKTTSDIIAEIACDAAWDITQEDKQYILVALRDPYIVDDYMRLQKITVDNKSDI